MNDVAITAGGCVAGGYLIGTIPTAYLVTRSRLRRDLRHIDSGRPPKRPAGPLAAGALEAAKALLAATIAWKLMTRVAPGFGRAPHFSGVGEFSDQVLTAWQSVALWAGAAAVAGDVAPIRSSFRGGTGAVAVGALLFVYAPAALSVGMVAFGATLAISRATERATIASAGAVVLWCWVAWAFDWQAGRGMPHGPELSLWATVVAGIVAAAALAREKR